MQFKVGDVVVHPAYGMGHVVNIKEKQFSQINAAKMYYQITMPNHSTVWTPVKTKASGLRLVTVKSDLDQYRNLLKTRPVYSQTERHRQHLELVSRLKEGSFWVMCEVVRDLTLSDWQKPLGITNKTILRKTREKLYQEWAIAADISVAEATEEINTLLETAVQESQE